MEHMIALLTEFLDLKKPIDIRLKTKLPHEFKNTRAIHYSWVQGSKVLRHVIQIRLTEDGRNLETIIAHEMIHAWQAEHKPKSKEHGKCFQDTALHVLGYLKAEGFNIQDDIYCHGLDV